MIFRICEIPKQGHGVADGAVAKVLRIHLVGRKHDRSKQVPAECTDIPNRDVLIPIKLLLEGEVHLMDVWQLEARIDQLVRSLRNRIREGIREYRRVHESLVRNREGEWNGRKFWTGEGRQRARGSVVAPRAIRSLHGCGSIGAAVIKHPVTSAQHASPVVALRHLIGKPDPRSNITEAGFVDARAQWLKN